MKYNLPEIIGSWRLTVGKTDVSTRADELQLPKITFTDKEYRAGGIAGPLSLPTGEVELGEITFKVTGKGTDLIQAKQVCSVDGAVLVFTGSNRVNGGCSDGSTTQVIMRGRLAEFDIGQMKAGEDNVTTFNYKPVSVRVKEAGTEVLLIDIINPKKNHIKGDSIS